MNNSTTIYLLAENSNLKNWGESLSTNLKLIANNFFSVNETFSIEIYTGKLSNADKHIFILADSNMVNTSENISTTNKTYQIHLQPTPFNLIPPFLQEVPVFDFFDLDTTTQSNSWINLNDSENNSWEKLLDFSKYLFNIYKQDKETIYLAQTSLDQKPNREKIKQDLLNKGYIITPATPLNTENPSALEKQITALAKKAVFSIHIYGNDANKVSEIGLVELQNKICAKTISNQKNRLMWLPADVTLNKENTERISLLRKDLELLKHAEFVEAPLEVFKSLLYKKISTNLSDSDNGEKGVYFIYDNQENEDIKKIKTEIQKNKLKILEVDNLKEHPLLNHKNNLNNSKGVIIYYDGKNSKWIDNILNDIIKTPKFRNNKKGNTIGIICHNKLHLKPEIESYNLKQLDITNTTQLESFIQNTTK